MVIKIWVNEKYCKGCLICVNICLTGALKASEEIKMSAEIIKRSRYEEILRRLV
jgi:Pyruvate/2-oxoacid:ferredoxin oxidoreductase delta subunit